MVEGKARPETYRRRAQTGRRRRFSVDFMCEITGTKGHAVGQVRDLAVGGCLIYSPCAFPLRETVDLVLDGPSGDDQVRLRAELRWMALGRSEGSIALGCRFMHANGSEQRIERMLHDMIRTPSSATLPKVRAEASSTGELKMVFASKELGKLLRPGP